MSYRILVTGSRDWDDERTLFVALQDALTDAWISNPDEDVVIVHGHCPTGADALAHKWATEVENAYVEVEAHPADWEKHGKAAGPIRNQQMVDLGANVCLAFPKATSRGTRHCMSAAEKAGIPVRIYEG